MDRGPEALIEWRERTNTSRQQLAEMLHLKHSASVYQYETRRLPFIWPHLVALERITGISIWVLAWPEQRQVMEAVANSPRQATPLATRRPKRKKAAAAPASPPAEANG